MTEARVWFDGASKGNPGPAGAGAVVEVDGRREVLSKALGRATNNEAEYQGLIMGLAMAEEMGARRVTVKGDSQLVVYQLDGRYRVNADNLVPLHRRAEAKLAAFEEVTVAWVPREENGAADEAANRALG